MNRRRIRRGLQVLTLAALAAALVAPGAAQADPAKDTPAKPGKEIPCEPAKKPNDPPLVKVDKVENKNKDKKKDNGKPVAVLVCGDIEKVNGGNQITGVTLKTAKGPIAVQVTGKTVVVKGDAKVPVEELKPGLSVAVKGEVFKNGSIRAVAIALL